MELEAGEQKTKVQRASVEEKSERVRGEVKRKTNCERAVFVGSREL